MQTDAPPRRKALREQFDRSDRLGRLPLPRDRRLRRLAAAIETALQTGKCAPVRKACARFLAAAARFYRVPALKLTVRAARPVETHEGQWTEETFGDYDPETMRIRVWMRTAVRRQVTSFGTFLAALCHEFCHHLDCTRFGFLDSPHTRGFFERSAALYHHARGTRRKALVWVRLGRTRWRIDWPRTTGGR